ncbi:50S ribosomal protein L34e [Candidatus Woesearchaeota archaeon]|nr:50S ribosomal protein L34e [Candidatus Woesearchaeota archaeon]
MVNPSRRSRSKRRVFRKTPGGKLSMLFKKRKSAKAQCASCGSMLSGVARVRATQLRTLAKTEKRPERPYGGVLCSACMRRTMIARARQT